MLKFDVPNDHSMKERFPILPSDQVNLASHPLILKILGGHPQAITLAGSLLEHQSLLSLFKQLLNSSMMEVLDMEDNKSFSSLKLSLEMSIKNLQKTSPKALDLFKIIGLLPGGITEQELSDLLQNYNWQQSKLILIKSSMIIYTHADTKISMLPFMATSA